MNTYDMIKYWDDNLVEQHVGSELAVISNYFESKNKSNLVYLDIGANSGKYHDVLARSFTIDHAIMVEASEPLYNYLLSKFKNTTFDIYNNIISDNNNDISFVDIDFSYITDIKSMNLGLSKLYNSINNNRKQTNAADFFIENIIDKNINHLDLIKIDTENRDYNIVKSLTPVVNKLKNQPIIVFEHNHHHDMTQDEAQTIIDNFCITNRYKHVDISKLEWSSVFLWP